MMVIFAELFIPALTYDRHLHPSLTVPVPTSAPLGAELAISFDYVDNAFKKAFERKEKFDK